MPNRIVALLTVAVCFQEARAADSEPAPTAERVAFISVEGFKGTTYAVNIDGTSVLYQTEPNSWPLGRRWKAITKSEAEVTALIEQLKTLGVFEWDGEYACNMMDGVWWSLQVSWVGQKVQVRGFNDFPPRFAEVQRAIEDFVGEPFEIPVRYCPPESKLVPAPSVLRQPQRIGKERPPGGALDDAFLRDE